MYIKLAFVTTSECQGFLISNK